MKKSILLISILTAIAVNFTSCGKNEMSGGTGGEASAHVFYYTFSDPYITSVRSALDKELKDEEQTKPKLSWGKKIIKIREEMNET